MNCSVTLLWLALILLQVLQCLITDLSMMSRLLSRPVARDPKRAEMTMTKMTWIRGQAP